MINLVGTCHEKTDPGVPRRRSILDDEDGALAGLRLSSLPSGHGTHADSMLLYVCSIEPGVRLALLSTVPLQELAGLIPKECLTEFYLKLPLNRKHRAWTQLYDVFQDVDCELADLA